MHATTYTYPGSGDWSITNHKPNRKLKLQAHSVCSKDVPAECTFGLLEPIYLPPHAISIPRTEVPMEAIIGVQVRRREVLARESFELSALFLLYFQPPSPTEATRDHPTLLDQSLYLIVLPFLLLTYYYYYCYYHNYNYNYNYYNYYYYCCCYTCFLKTLLVLVF